MVEWMKLWSLNYKVVGSIPLVAVVALGKAGYLLCLVPRRGLEAISFLGFDLLTTEVNPKIDSIVFFSSFFHPVGLIYRVAQKECNDFDRNFKDIINKTELIFISLCGKVIFQQNDTMIINFG